MNRKQIAQALFDLLKTASVFKSSSRRMKLWADVPASERPALYMHESAETYDNAEDFNPGSRTMRFKAFVYTNASDSPAAPVDQLNDILEAFETALAPNPLTGLQTLGGVVTHARINGEILKDAGDLDGDGVLVVPFEILLP